MANIGGIIILDGFGEAVDKSVSAIDHAQTPFIDSLKEKYPSTLINASGLFVGLPDGQMGNSEVGHLNIGAGRVVYQELTRISKDIEDGGFFNNEKFLIAIDNAKQNNKKLHLIGLASSGGVHSHIHHLENLIKLAKANGISPYIHCFMDGRDVSPTSGIKIIARLAAFLESEQCGEIASISGRYYAMDRDNRWDRVEKAYDALTSGIGETANDPNMAVATSYENGLTDEFIVPTVILKDNEPVATIDNGDSVIFFNFRPDRAREMTRALTQKNFKEFKVKTPLELVFVTFTCYDIDFLDVIVAYDPQTLTNTFGEHISSLGLKQLRIAETEKYAHVTFFFNGGVEKQNENEDRVLIPSPKIATYDLKPEMSAFEVADEAVARINSGEYDCFILNFANSDMVGHTGMFDAAVKGVETVDKCVALVVDAVLANGGKCIVTADHGNADCMMTKEGKPFTAHTNSQVPFILVDNENINASLKQDGCLCDVVPTLFSIMNIEKPTEMSGESLIIK